VPSLDDIADSHSLLTGEQVSWLQMLVADWQIMADLSFSDLVLWVEDAESQGMWAAAQIRPTTGPTTLAEDVVGKFLPAGLDDLSDEQLPDGTIVEHTPVRVVYRGASVAVIVRRSAAAEQRAVGVLESAYRQASDELFAMVGRGQFPFAGSRSELADTLRVGDGLIRTDGHGLVTYASPNALSAYRRLGHVGDLIAGNLDKITAEVAGPQAARAIKVPFGSGEVLAEVDGAGASVLLRVIALGAGNGSSGSLILLRDVTELRLRDRQLVSKNATIREIHHRVKNNLQTVAALLRLQSRRIQNPEAREALVEAEQRVGSIALVHETLSQSFDETVEFDAIADTLLRTVLEVGGSAVRGQRIGSFGALPAEVATPLAMVLTELVQNAAEHAFGPQGGRVTIAVNRIRNRIRMRISDDGRGLPADFDPTRSLGLSIVSTLVQGELAGNLNYETPPSGGTTVTIELNV